MSLKPFTEREFELMKLALQCVENPKGLKIDIGRYQELAGFSTQHSARSSWCSLKVKLGVNTSKLAAANAEDSTNNPAPAEAQTPKTSKKRKLAASPSDDSPVFAKKRTKKATKSAQVNEPEKAQSEQEVSPQATSEGNGSPS